MGLCLCRTSAGSVLPAWMVAASVLERPRWLLQEVIRIDDPGPRPFPRCFCSKKITVSTRGTLPYKEFRHKQRRLSPASRRGWRGGSWSFSKGECMNVCVRSLGQRVETASGAGAGQRSRHRCPGGREEWPRAPVELEATACKIKTKIP